jgi:rubrerythrin
MGNTDLAGILREAMEAERDGFTFYTMAAEQSEDPGARETFARLADEERKHYEALQAGYRSLAEQGTWSPSTELLNDREPEAKGIFSEDFVRRIGGKHLEMSALSIGILLEKNAYAFYTRQAEAAEDEAVAGFFRELAEWEDGHYRLLLRQDEALKEEYWNENRFAPLL